MNEFVGPSAQGPRMPVIPSGPPRDRKWYWLSIGFVNGLVLTSLIIWLFSLRSENEVPVVVTPTADPTVTVSPRPTSTPSPSPTVNPADWTFEVLNGSEVNGAAAKAAQILRERGYIVKKVDNADKSTYAETQLLVTADRSEAAQALLTDLKTAFPLDEVEAILESTSVTARLILGKDWQPPTTSPKASVTPSPR